MSLCENFVNLPAFEIDFIPTKVKVLVRENLCDFLKERLEEGIDTFLGWVHGAQEAVLFSPRIVASAFTNIVCKIKLRKC